MAKAERGLDLTEYPALQTRSQLVAQSFARAPAAPLPQTLHKGALSQAHQKLNKPGARTQAHHM